MLKLRNCMRLLPFLFKKEEGKRRTKQKEEKQERKKTPH